MRTVFEAAGGHDALRRLAERPQHVERLAAYWAEALGGPTTYSDSYGDETNVVKMHSGSGEHAEMDRRAIACFDRALADVGLANDGALRQVLHDYFAWATTTGADQDREAHMAQPIWSLTRHHSRDADFQQSSP